MDLGVGVRPTWLWTTVFPRRFYAGFVGYLLGKDAPLDRGTNGRDRAGGGCKE